MVPAHDVRDPGPATHGRNGELYQRVYRRRYGRLRPLYRDIRRITGCPPG